MKKKVFGRKFKRDTNERKALFKNLLTSLVLHERIKTTEAKAKAIRSVADKLITKAKKGGEHAARLLHPDVNQEAVTKLLGDLAPRFATRNGGYTRIVKIGKRRVADNAPMVYMEWTETAVVQVAPAKKVSKKASTKATKKTVKKETSVKVEKTVPVVDTKPAKGEARSEQQKPKTGGFLKQLITRQKKG
jgi:large subunit ribosomal protein L17